MTVLQKGKSVYPFFGEQMNLITGLDPLGLQVASEATYAMLLPGISNLTNRMRYYGFYCWLLDKYRSIYTEGNSQEQYRFIRRAELMLALIMQSEFEEVTQVTGSLYAKNLINTESKSYYDLSKGADKDKSDDVYWKFPSGAFGQYYYGAMQAMGLVALAQEEEGDTIFVATKSKLSQTVCGNEIAIAFENNLNQNAISIFVKNIGTGRLLKSDVKFLSESFQVKSIPPTSTEWIYYKTILLDRNFPPEENEDDFTWYRSQTINNLLKHSIHVNDNSLDWYAWVNTCYTKKILCDNPQVFFQDAEVGWYYYRLNEYWHYASGAIFWAVLFELTTLNAEPPAMAFIEKFSDDTTKQLGKTEKSLKAGDPINLEVAFNINWTEENLINEINSSIKSKDSTKTAAFGIILLFKLVKENKNYFEQLQDYLSHHRLYRDGEVVSGLQSILQSSRLPLRKVVQSIIHKKIVYRHQIVALRKMGNSSTATFKFLIEDERLRALELFPPRFTSPRLNALNNLLYDLGVVDKENDLTELATSFLEK
jgi:hypothetical protein